MTPVLASLRITAFCSVAKQFTTKKQGKKNMRVTTCEIKISAVRCMRESADFLSGVPRGTVAYLFSETGMPFQGMQIKLPKRALTAKGYIEARNKDGGAIISRLNLENAIARKFRFELDTPDDTGPTLDTEFNLMWKTAGDEGTDIEPLLDENCYMDLEFIEQPVTLDMFSASPKAEAEAGDRAKLDRKRRASGEKPSDSDAVAPIVPATPPAAAAAAHPDPDATIGTGKQAEAPPTNVVPIKGSTKKKAGMSIAELTKDAQEHAKKHPRKDPPTPPNSPKGRGPRPH